ncbi:MAG: cell envelope biogenesis protein OmpA [Pseudooceanicola sp.]|jgi:OOP family OmpA-OmpF porin|nr:cell envelope biogenesis protein OmpA [Pseudooceanicola sp.]|tara:strand:- start:910 stop:1842 length:933 start_codon:yes stop_codon:yes gene_type:complete
MRHAAALVAACMVAVPPVLALDLALPKGAEQISDRASPLDSYALPTGPFAETGLPVRRMEGRVDRQTWRISGAGLTTLQILAALRKQVLAAGYEIVFECNDVDCGGFDFRFATEVVPAPDMHVDVRNYRFLSATHGDSEATGILVSRTRNAAYVQIILVSPDGALPLTMAPSTAPDVQTPVGSSADASFADRLIAQGHVALDGLTFATGSDALAPGEYASLDGLAEFAQENPNATMVLVGHTDAVGALEQNISLSRRRAQSVRARLIDRHGVAADRLQAEGMGYLAPVASNLTAEGRELNRRVEVVLLSR